jgi:hypothetical protein
MHPIPGVLAIDLDAVGLIVENDDRILSET